MSQDLTMDWLPKLRARYQNRNRQGKSRMLDELCADYDYERKYAIKLLRGTVAAPSGRPHPGPERLYDVIEPVVRQMWLTAEQPCGKRLAPILRTWLPYYERHYGELSGRQRKLLRHISPATLDRLLAPARAEFVRGRSSPVYFTDVTPEMKALIDRSGRIANANGQLFKRKVGAGVIAVRRGGATHALDTIYHFLHITQMILPGAPYWNFGIGRDVGDVEKDEEGIANMKGLGENIAWLLKKLHA